MTTLKDPKLRVLIIYKKRNGSQLHISLKGISKTKGSILSFVGGRTGGDPTQGLLKSYDS